MSALVCALSGEVPVEPVISVKSGNLFEKRLIEGYVNENGVCPITREPLSLQDLVPVQSGKAVKPRSAAHTSLQGMMGSFQNEWDAMVLETFKLRELLNEARMELSHTLYQHDAACRCESLRRMRQHESRKETFLFACTKSAGSHRGLLNQSNCQAHEGKG
jgi:pre-mRNA-processing factor 19